MPDHPQASAEPATVATAGSHRIDALLDQSLLLDLETGLDGTLHKIGALRAGGEFRREGPFDLGQALAALTDFAADAPYVIGHNLLGHDLPTLRALAPALALLRRPIVDTLYLSPLAFPQNPYHRLVKDYRLVRDSAADPVADCRLAAQILREQFAELARRAGGGEADLIAVYRFCFQGATLLDGNATGGDGIAAVFALLAPGLPSVTRVRDTLLARWQGRACTTTAPRLILAHLKTPDLRPALAYAAAWLTVAGGNSVLPPWVRHRFPATRTLLDALREVPCGAPDCAWCREAHDPNRQLKRWFNFDAFRPQPATDDGASLQQAVVSDGIAARALLAILPTGGGKSLCFQLPGLVRYLRRGTLTVVISPLQALMKDQVDNLVRKTGATCTAAIYGMLTPPERGDVMERVRLGDIAILYLSPEQLRNRSVADMLASREIGCWVFDEAHCLSKWGHDFRPDYLYASRFIRTLAERQRLPVPPVACFTATAKLDVTAEVLTHFRDELGIDMRLFEGGVERDNLGFEVQLAGKHEKDARIHAILGEHLGEPSTPSGAAIVYASRRKRTEALADRLQREGWAVAAFHAGLEAPEKRRIQDAFVDGELTIICATNAFGMGVDKEDVRLVIHADIPASLENYIQEAGRAGRDRRPALCVLLYDQQDIEGQFGMEALSQLSQRDIAEILKGLKRAKPGQDGAVVVTSGDLLRDEDLRLGFDTEARDADTRVRIAISWLERAGLVRRDENRTGVFQGRPVVPDLSAAERRIAGLNLSAAQRARWLAILEELLNAEPDAGLTADDLARLPACKGQPGANWDKGQTPAQRVLRTLHDMARAGLIDQGPQLTAFVRHKVKRSSTSILERVSSLERVMLAALREEAPDAGGGDWQQLSLRRLNQRLLDQEHDSNPETLRALLKGLALDGQGLAGARGSLDLRQTDRDHYRVRLHRDWPALTATAERRQAVAQLVLKTLLAKLPADAPAGADLLLRFGVDELTRAIAADLVLGGQVTDPLAAVHRGLLFLHEHGAIILHQGLAVFRSAMTVQVLPEAKGRRYSKAQYQPLAQHYGERVFQIHVMDRYARLGAEQIRQALTLVAGYFSLGKEAFVRRWFGDQRQMLTRATTAESFARIVDDLKNPEQIEIVAAPEDGNRLVLAGPGAGKTRVIVHRCAYLLRVLRVPSQRILVLCFNRGAALTLRRRLAALVGDEARHVSVQTYHGFAMRLTGHSYAERLADAERQAPDFDAVLTEAVALLEGRVDLPGIEPDAARERLLAGYRHILVDEYQDIDADQYRLVSGHRRAHPGPGRRRRPAHPARRGRRRPEHLRLPRRQRRIHPPLPRRLPGRAALSGGELPLKRPHHRRRQCPDRPQRRADEDRPPHPHRPPPRRPAPRRALGAARRPRPRPGAGAGRRRPGPAGRRHRRTPAAAQGPRRPPLAGLRGPRPPPPWAGADPRPLRARRHPGAPERRPAAAAPHPRAARLPRRPQDPGPRAAAPGSARRAAAGAPDPLARPARRTHRRLARRTRRHPERRPGADRRRACANSAPAVTRDDRRHRRPRRPRRRDRRILLGDPGRAAPRAQRRRRLPARHPARRQGPGIPPCAHRRRRLDPTRRGHRRHRRRAPHLLRRHDPRPRDPDPLGDRRRRPPAPAAAATRRAPAPRSRRRPPPGQARSGCLAAARRAAHGATPRPHHRPPLPSAHPRRPRPRLRRPPAPAGPHPPPPRRPPGRRPPRLAQRSQPSAADRPGGSPDRPLVQACRRRMAAPRRAHRVHPHPRPTPARTRPDRPGMGQQPALRCLGGPHGRDPLAPRRVQLVKVQKQVVQTQRRNGQSKGSASGRLHHLFLNRSLAEPE